MVVVVVVVVVVCIACCIQIGAAAGSLSSVCLRMALPEAEILAWGWRCPFIISLPVCRPRGNGEAIIRAGGPRVAAPAVDAVQQVLVLVVVVGVGECCSLLFDSRYVLHAIFKGFGHAIHNTATEHAIAHCACDQVIVLAWM